MAAVAGAEFVLVRGEGVFVWDDQGRRYLDGSSSLWYANVGHGRTEITDAIKTQLAELESFHTFGDSTNRPARELAERLAALAPQQGSKVFLTNGGGDSIETATKLARLWHRLRGEPERQHLISRTGGYHGTHGIGTSILGMPYKDEFGPLVERTSRVQWDDPAALEAEIGRLGAESVAAFVFEPVIGSGGVLVPPPGYLTEVERICRDHGVLTIADVVIGGFGRLGTWLAVERFDLTPDLIVFAKGVTSGYLPLGGVIAAPNIAEPFWTAAGTRPTFAHGTTYSGHPTCCAAAIANLDLLAADGLVSRALDLESSFHQRLTELHSHNRVGEIRGGVGLMAAIALDPELVLSEPDVAQRLWSRAREAGLLTRWLRDGVALAPPLTIEEGHIEFALHTLASALDGIA
jgi:putrescine---pyruvate transaminase